MMDYPLSEDFVINSFESIGAAQMAVNLAVDAINLPDVSECIAKQAVEIIYKYADWKNIPMPSQYKLEMMKRDFDDKA